MQIRVVFDDSEVEAMVNKLNRKPYSKVKMKSAGEKVKKAYAEFEKVKKKDEPSPGQVTIDQLLKTFGGKVVEKK